jgi:heme-degrading monooxygenase HmoA
LTLAILLRVGRHRVCQQGKDYTALFARVSTYQFAPNQVDQGAEAFNRATESLRQMSGVKGAYFLIDRASGKALTITLWESEEALTASEEAANRLRSDAAGSAGGTVQNVERYEVAFHQEF